MATLFFSAEPADDYASAMRADRQQYAAFFQGLLQRGVYFPPAQFEAFFTSRAHTDADVDATIKAATEVFA
jgi:glutamate-1-semialdehyde 2,1-aminomutase